MKDSNSQDLAGGLLVGAVLGTVVGLVLAPRSGKATRQTLKKSAAAVPDMAIDISTSARLCADHAATAARRRWSGVFTRLQAAAAAGQAAYHREAIRSTLPAESARRRD